MEPLQTETPRLIEPKSGLSKILKASDIILVPTSLIRYVAKYCETTGALDAKPEITNPFERTVIGTMARLIVYTSMVTAEIGRLCTYSKAYDFYKDLLN